MIRHILLPLGLLAMLPGVASGEVLTLGGDVFVGGPAAGASPGSGRDLFAAGFSVDTGGPVAADAHVAGFSVDVDEPVGQSLYAAGANLGIDAAIGQDLAASGFTVETGPEAEVRGNARLAGGSVTVGGPILGALMATGGEVTIDAPIGGDVRLAAGTVRFGSNARIDGTLHYAAPDPVEIPATVIAPERVTYDRLEGVEGDWMPEHPRQDWPAFGPLAMLGSALATLAFFVVLGAIFLAFMPERVEALRARGRARPGHALLAGALGLSLLFGLIPVSAMTIVGLPLIPFVLLAGVLAWTLGYLLGAYILAMAVLDAVRGGPKEHGMGPSLLALVLGIAAAALLNFIPFLGWLANLGIVFLGVGAMTAALLARSSEPPAPAPSA